MARTETVTVVFTDLVGSTELASRLGHDAYEALRHEHFSTLRAAVAKHNGSEVKTTGDGLMLSFDSAANAVACAVSMQQAVVGQGRQARRPVLSRVEGPATTINPEPPNSSVGAGVPACPPVQIRIGLSSGEATRDNNDLFGAPVVEASRLCAAASAGQILISEVVRLMARGHGHTFTSVGELTLKGLPEPLPACEVRWEPLPKTPPVRVPLPPRLATAPTIAMVGREAELATLTRAYEAAKGGQRQIVLLAGAPGIGKTRLATETAGACHADGATVLLGACDEDASLPYQPFIEALRHYVAHAPEEVLRAHVEEHRGEVGRLIPELGRRIADLPPGLWSCCPSS